ncbi:MAG: hypothetical protein LBQ77_04165 [Treponema sp.]|jgi:V/A-type H+-transporting ATPase subunit I|nr:hypothetical protein [Treponema sp.]
MIVPMKKVSIVTLEKNRDESLEALRSLGVVHLEKKHMNSEALSRLIGRKTKAEQALGILRNYTAVQTSTGEKPHDIVYKTLSLIEERKQIQEQLFAHAKEQARIEKWGDFNPEDLNILASAGVNLIPYQLTQKEYETLEKQPFIVLGSDKTTVYGVAVNTELKGITPWTVPERSLGKLRTMAAEAQKRLGAIEQELTVLAAYTQQIESMLDTVDQDIEFEAARANMEKIEDQQYALLWLNGFIPYDKVDALKKTVAEQKGALVISDPTETDRPPTLVKNNAFVRLIQPLFSFLGTVPGYREYDISFSYLLFFCLFFAMIFGDAAYGTLLFILVLLLGVTFKKKSGKIPDAIKLFGLLALCTIVWGSINGAWFATPYENLPPFLQVLVIKQFNPAEKLAEFPGFLQNIFHLPEEAPNNTAQWNVQFLCFTVAIIQLVWAHIKNIKKTAPSLTAFAQAGWLVMMIGLYFLVLFMLLKVPLPSFATYLIGIGLGTYFIFANQTGGNFFANIGKSFANFLPTFLNAVSSFADIISYIRLFAVGLAGTAIAQSFNEMGMGIPGLAGKIIGGSLILIFGHSLNIVMNALSVIVHGVRLNLLEYAGNHLSMEWSGYAYKPFNAKK